MALELTRDFPELDHSRLLSPIAFARVTGLASTTRRLWRTRGLVPFDRRDDGSPAARHRSSWLQATQYALMSKFAQVGIGLRVGGEVAADPKVTSLALVDFRRDKKDDILLVGLIQPDETIKLLTTGVSRPFPKTDIGCFLVNFSATQREMIKRYLKIRDEVLEEIE